MRKLSIQLSGNFWDKHLKVLILEHLLWQGLALFTMTHWAVWWTIAASNSITGKDRNNFESSTYDSRFQELGAKGRYRKAVVIKSRSAIIRTWLKYNIGKETIQWYTVVKQKRTLLFKLSRAVRQGDLLFPYLFILVSEVLAINIRNDRTIIHN